MFEAQVRRFVEGRDADDNPVTTWSVPEPFAVNAAAPGPSDELVRAGRDVQAVAWTLYVPAGTVLGPRDVIVWQGVDYRVDGAPLDWSFSPWPSMFAGVVVALKRVTG